PALSPMAAVAAGIEQLVLSPFWSAPLENPNPRRPASTHVDALVGRRRGVGTEVVVALDRAKRGRARADEHALLLDLLEIASDPLEVMDGAMKELHGIESCLSVTISV